MFDHPAPHSQAYPPPRPLRPAWLVLAVLALNALLGAFMLWQGTGVMPRAASAQQACSLNILVFSKTAGFRHNSIPAGITAIQNMAAANGWTVSATENASLFTASFLAGFDVVIFLSTTGDILNATQQTAFEGYIRAGGGFAGIHAASDTEYNWPWYGGLVGAYFANHPDIQPARIIVEEPAHASAITLPNPWIRTDEWYNFQTNPRPVVNVVLSLDETSYTGGTMGDHPIAWYRYYDGGRSFYTAMGHASSTFSEPLFLDHIEGGIRWAGGCEAPVMELAAPAGTVTNAFGNPTYSWTDMPGASYYYLYVVDAAGRQIINEVISDTGYCNGVTCSIDPTTLRHEYRLSNGVYYVWLNTWNGSGQGTWAGPFAFTLNAPPPGLVSLQTPTGTNTLRPTLRWNLTGAAQNTTWFNVYLLPVAGGAPAIYQWYERAQVCGSPTGSTCSLVSPVDLIDGTQYHLYVLSYGPGGSSTGGTGGYAGPLAFSVDAPTPSLPANVQVSVNQGRPTIRWNNDPSATHFQVFISGAAGVVYNQWHERTGSLCPSSTCAVTPEIDPLNGAYTVFIRAYGPGGYSQGGTEGWAGPVNFTLNFGPPDLAADLSVQGVSTGRPTYRWMSSAGATWHELVVVNAATGQIMLQQWYLASSVGCQNPGQCSVRPPLDLANGSYQWYVRSYGPGGYSTGGVGGYAGPASFSVGAGAPATASPGLPNGTITVNNPAFTWPHVSSATYYQVWMGTAAFQALHLQWHRAEDLVCQDDNTCTLVIPGLALANGDYQWYVQTFSPGGLGAWSGRRDFRVAVPMPAAPALTSPADDAVIFNTNRPTFTWTAVAFGEWYLLELVNGMGLVAFAQWFQGSAICTPQPNPTACTAQVPAPIAYGGYRWRVQSYSQGGYGETTWSPARDFISLSINTQPMVVQSEAVQTEGLWAVQHDERALGGSYLISSAGPQDALVVTFEGTQADVIYLAGPRLGSFVVEVDGVPLLTVSANAAETAYGQVASIGALPFGLHTLRIVPLDAAAVAIDAVAVDGAIVTDSPAPTDEPGSGPTPGAETPAGPEPTAPEPTTTPEPTATSEPVTEPSAAPTDTAEFTPEPAPEATEGA